MSWEVKRIQEDDYGCEERQENEKTKVIVTLADKNGQERQIQVEDACVGKQIRVEDDWLYAKGINEGDLWPDTLLETKEYIF